MAGVNSEDIGQNLLSILPFSDLKTVVDLCRSLETSIQDCEALSIGSKIDRIIRSDVQEKCQKCGREKHSNDICTVNNSTCSGITKKKNLMH